MAQLLSGPQPTARAWKCPAGPHPPPNPPGLAAQFPKGENPTAHGGWLPMLGQLVPSRCGPNTESPGVLEIDGVSLADPPPLWTESEETRKTSVKVHWKLQLSPP